MKGHTPEEGVKGECAEESAPGIAAAIDGLELLRDGFSSAERSMVVVVRAGGIELRERNVGLPSFSCVVMAGDLRSRTWWLEIFHCSRCFCRTHCGTPFYDFA